jgi:tight adherence protein B
VSAILGAMLGAGLLLAASPWLWPRSFERPAHTASRMGERLVRAGLGGVSPAVVIAVAVLLGVASAATVFAVTSVIAIALAAGAVAGVLPGAVIGWRARARQQATRVVWPDVVDQLVSAIRSGLALAEAVVTLAHTGPLVTREAFVQFERDYRMTGNFSHCLDSLKDRLADPIADRIIETLRMSREVGGGELTTVLRNLGSYLRQESAIRSEVLARQSWVRNAAKLGVAAPWVVLVLLATRPEAAAAYNSPAGAILIVTGLVVSVVAYRVMIGLGRLPEEPRWFA